MVILDNIDYTVFNYNHHYSFTKGSYIRQECDLVITVIKGEDTYVGIFQTGAGFYYGDYSTPTTELSAHCISKNGRYIPTEDVDDDVLGLMQDEAFGFDCSSDVEDYLYDVVGHQEDNCGSKLFNQEFSDVDFSKQYLFNIKRKEGV